MSITILKPGIMSSVQDLGRWGYQQYGVPIGGAMDKFSAALTNIICGNDENEGVIEMTLHGASILFNEDKFCAFTGGGCRVFAEEMELPFNRLLYIPALTMLETKPSATGCRSYFAVAGGFDIRKQMGSVSTYAASGIGGMNGRYLKSGDMLSFKKINPSFDLNALKTISGNLRVSHWQVPDLIGMDQQSSDIYVLAGPEYDRFDEASKNKFFASTFTIGLQSNRMGYRLEGEKILMKEKHEMVSTPVTSGIIQVTHEGDPIILMADAQTTGGYPRIARVCSTDIARLAQMRPGEQFRFLQITEEESQIRYDQIANKIKKLKSGIVFPN
jgi:antagonist of KipI